MNAYATLVAARSRISDARHWCKRAAARTMGGAPVSSTGDLAASFCAVGALTAAASPECQRGTAWDELYAIVVDSVEATGGVRRSLVDFNDDPTTTHADVLRVFDHAINRVSRENGDTACNPQTSSEQPQRPEPAASAPSNPSAPSSAK